MILRKATLLFTISAFLMAAIVLSHPVFSLSAKASSFSGGSGTKSDPYMIKTPQDLDGMRDALSSHFKLAATIDIASLGEFEPIGCLGKPFTGTFTCDKGSDGYPLYAIKNLKVYNHAGENYNHVAGQAGAKYYLDYDSKGFSYWETALFGAIKNASLNNLYILNADIKTTVVGQAKGVYYGQELVPIPGVNDMGTGILVGISNDSTITGCTVTGKIDSKSNHTGAFAGQLINTTVSYCYANAAVKSDGHWHNGGFAGSIKSGTNVKFCAADGTLDTNGFTDSPNTSAGVYNGGFVGSFMMGATVSDSYTNVNIIKETVFNQSVPNSYSFAGFYGEADGTSVSNCFATGTVKGISNVQVNTTAGLPDVNTKSINSFVLAVPGAIQHCFAPASKTDIISSFAGKKGWITSGELPVISGLMLLKDEGIFVSGKERDGAKTASTTVSQGSTNSGQQGGTTSGDDSSGETMGETTEETTEETEETADGISGTETTSEKSIGTLSDASGERNGMLIILSAIVCVICVASFALLLQLALQYRKAISKLKSTGI